MVAEMIGRDFLAWLKRTRPRKLCSRL